MRISYEGNRFGHYTITNDQDDRTIYVQTDFDYPGIASTFGWSPCCGSGRTDGTVRCPDCGAEVSDLIGSAIDFLDANEGSEVDDPGYFDGEV